MLRLLRPAFSALVAAAVLGAVSAQPAALAQVNPSAAQASGSALSVEQARAAAIRILNAVKNGDAKARFGQFSPAPQAVTSPSMIAATMRSQPKVLGYQLLSVRSGLDSSIVEAEIKTQAGNRVVFMVISPEGLIDRYYVDRADDDDSKVALQFVQAVSTGNFITAQSFLAPSVQEELTPAVLQARWLGLQRLTG